MNTQPKPIHSILAILLLASGAICRFGGKISAALNESNPPPLFGWIMVASAVMWIWGCFHLAIARRINPAWGLLGVFFIVGLLIILWIARKQPAWDRLAAESGHAKGTHSYQGDPDSPY